VHVIFDRFADVQLINFGARRNGNTLHADGMRLDCIAPLSISSNPNRYQGGLGQCRWRLM
jgi:hypothetical protein